MSKQNLILTALKESATTKQQAFDNTHKAFNILKGLLRSYAQDMNKKLSGYDKRVHLTYTDRGRFEAQLQIATDLLIFSMHSNIFSFERSNPIWQNSYVEKEPTNAYSGIINIYNFLSDSVKYNRIEDQGYLVGRIFINRENRYIVEGKRQITSNRNSFSEEVISEESLLNIIDNAIHYSLVEFELLTPPYDLVKLVSVDQMNNKIVHSKTQTGKRIGYQFLTDDV